MGTTLLIIFGTLLLVVGVVAGWLLTLFAMPGNWLIVVAAALHAWLMPADSRWDLSWQLVGVLVVLAVVGEIIEGVAGAAGVRKLGGSRRGALLSIVGSIGGALAGTALIPVPIVGTLLGAGIGAMLGAIAGETWKGNAGEQIERIGWAAFWGRIIGSLAKVIVACVMVAVTLVGAFV